MKISASGRASAQVSAANKPAAPPPTITMRSGIIRVKIADARTASHMKQVVRIRENRPVNDDFRDEHEKNDCGQRKILRGVAEFFQHAIQSKGEQQQKRDQ